METDNLKIPETVGEGDDLQFSLEREQALKQQEESEKEDKVSTSSKAHNETSSKAEIKKEKSESLNSASGKPPSPIVSG